MLRLVIDRNELFLGHKRKLTPHNEESITDTDVEKEEGCMKKHSRWFLLLMVLCAFGVLADVPVKSYTFTFMDKGVFIRRGGVVYRTDPPPEYCMKALETYGQYNNEEMVARFKSGDVNAKKGLECRAYFLLGVLAGVGEAYEEILNSSPNGSTSPEEGSPPEILVAPSSKSRATR